MGHGFSKPRNPLGAHFLEEFQRAYRASTKKTKARMERLIVDAVSNSLCRVVLLAPALGFCLESCALGVRAPAAPADVPPALAAMAVAIAQSPMLTHLLLRQCGIEGLYCSTVTDVLRQPEKRVRVLLLNDNPLGPSGARALAEALEDNEVLTALYLRSTALGADGAAALCKHLQNNAKLRSIDLAHNSIGAGGADAVIVMAQKSSLLTVWCEGNGFSSDIFDEISAAIEPRRKLYLPAGPDPFCPIIKGEVPSVHRVGVAEMQGFRPSMEDSVILHEKFLDERTPWHFYGMYDGHGSREPAIYAAHNLSPALRGMLLDRDLMEIIRESNRVHPLVRDCLRDAYTEINEIICRDHAFAGSTALSIVMSPTTIYCANAGDTRAVLCRAGRAIRLSVDHKPTTPEEQMRVEQLGGYVENGRVQAQLAVSRAFGDAVLKPYVIPDPHVSVTMRDPNDTYLILACDGVWDVVSDEIAMSVVESEHTPTEAARALRDLAYGLGSNDNISVLCIYLRES